MARNENILDGLRKLFQSNIIIRKSDDGKLIVKDVDHSQTSLTSNFIDRYNRLMQSSYGSQYSKLQNASYDVQRIELFKDYELMDNDPIISSALDIYADESTIDNVEKNILSIKTENNKIHEILYNLFYNILNIQYNLWSWIRNLTKYGDFYLQLDILDKYGVISVKPMSPYDVIRLEDHDIENPDLVQFTLHGDIKNLLEQYEVAHFRLLSDSNFAPYGKSQIEGARKVFKQLTLMEDAMMIHRIMRAPERRIFKIDIGNIPPNEVENFMNRMINKAKKTPVIDQKTGEYNLRYNIHSVTEDFFLPVRGSDSGTEIETLQGLSNDGHIEDIEYLRNKLMAALRIPKAFLGYEEGVGCVVPETEIPLLNGEIKTVKEIIEDYENGIKHYTYAIDLKTNMIVPGEIEWAGYTKKDAELVRVNLDNDKYIDCTPDHRFLTRDGEWIEAQDLEENQSLMPLYLRDGGYKRHYTEVYEPGTEKYKLVHKIVAEQYHNLEKGRVTHHKDFNSRNNNPENLDCNMNFWEHREYHSKLIEKTLNSPENMAKRVKEQKKNNHFEIAGRKGGLKSADKLVKWLKENGPWNRGKLSGETKKCVECKEEFYTEPRRNSQKCCSSECSTKYYTGDKRYNTKFMVEYDELVNIANKCNSFKELESNLGDIDRNTLNRIFEYNNIDKVDFIFNNMPLALKNKAFMQNYRKYEEQYLNHKVVSVEFLTETKDTCDLTITKYHNFATNAGVIIHNSKATLAAEDVRFARTIERLQKIVISELTKIAIVHLFTQGFTEADLLDFSLELQSPSTIHEQEKLELLSQKIDLANNARDARLFSNQWIYQNIFTFNMEEMKDMMEQVVEDTKQKYRFEQIETEGNDPAHSGEHMEEGEGAEIARSGDWGGSEKDFSRDEEKHWGRDRFGKKEMRGGNNTDRNYGKRDFKGKSPLAISKGSTVVKVEGLIDSLKKKYGKFVKNNGLLSESSIIEDENEE